MRYVIFILLIRLFFIQNVFAQTDTTSHYAIYNTQENREITLRELSAALLSGEVVFFGEEHDDSVAHAIQLNLLRALNDGNKDSLTLSMEMFQSDVQLVLDEYRSGLITEKNLNADGRLWNNYSDYRPLVEYAKENDIYILAANAPSRYTNRVTRGGLESLDSLSDQAKAYLAPLPIDTFSGRYHEKFSDLLGGHGAMAHLHLYQSQNLWDATMAWNIAQLKKAVPDQRILHINGRFHSDEHLGTVAQLKKYAPEVKILTISSFKVETLKDPEWEQWRELGDFIIITCAVAPETEFNKKAD